MRKLKGSEGTFRFRAKFLANRMLDEKEKPRGNEEKEIIFSES